VFKQEGVFNLQFNDTFLLDQSNMRTRTHPWTTLVGDYTGFITDPKMNHLFSTYFDYYAQ
jgi:hypothetical protein